MDTVTITLKNFKCFLSRTITFSSKEMVLLSAPSGSGKSTILAAINFALFNLGSNLITYGKSTCSVTITFSNQYTITRTKRPNRLTVKLVNGSVMEDGEAQCFINSRLGCAMVNFMELSNQERLGMLESIAYGCFNIDELKLKLKNKIGELNDNHKLCEGQIKVIEELIRSQPEPTKVDQVEPCVDDKTSLKTTITMIERQLQQNHNNALIQSKILNLNKSITELDGEIDRLKLDVVDDVDEKVKLLDMVQLANKIRDKLNDDRKTLMDLIEPQQHEEIDMDELSLSYQKRREVDQYLNDPNFAMVNQWTDERIQQEFIALKLKLSLSCPSCSASLYLNNNGSLEAIKTDIIEMDQLNHNLTIEKLGSIVDRLNKYRSVTTAYPLTSVEYKSKLDEAKLKLKHMQEYRIKKSMVQSSITNNTTKLDTINIHKDVDENKLRTLLALQKIIQTTIRTSITKRNNLVMDRDRLAKELKDNGSIDLDYLNAKLMDHRERYERAVEHQLRYDAYQLYLNKLNLHRANETKLVSLNDELKQLGQRYEAALLLKSKVFEAQTLALANVVDTLTINVQQWLDKFFYDQDLNITITLADTKVGNRVNIDLYHKGNKCDPSSLSSGEYARLSLAFTLAFAQLQPKNEQPMLLLDERTANLDQDLTTYVYGMIKDTFDGLIVVVAHQVISGPFDRVDTLNH